ncbi:hypothetical protein COT51_00915 [candidate division WWE3 bacterium CG08_land_8_20_14_0_20_41_15]|uniref:Uncharacterized protein n=1 Tax=candidate division WWE3 bacterium CG08_land_8_20_14_0_20_41_15 TaxID=1975086 RepID=A0A2H0XC95_UNCKA|nr:MAG: hypothetical protein COT51_00915 [candidate division WWE3 bacterium CG08_land_8_20_14_0_20_41_15]
MYNWNTEASSFGKKKPDFIIWKLNQLINFGLNGEKINFDLVKKYWKKLTLDPNRKKFLQALIWGKQS